MKTSLYVFVLVSIAGLAGLHAADANACTVTLKSTNSTVYPTVNAAVAAASQLSDTITINGSGGACMENVLVDNTHLRMIIQGVNGAVISGASTAPTLDLRVKGVEVANLTVSGGSRGIAIQRNTNAIISAVVVQNAAGSGITVSSMAFAVIVASTVQNNGDAGIAIYSLGSARIGLNFFEDGLLAYQGNTIVSNAHNGIVVIGNSDVQIYANTISANGRNGILIIASSSVTTGGNTINSNGRSGIEIVANSSLAVGLTPDLTAADPDQTTVANALYGISCSAGAVVLGTAGTLTGSSGQLSFADGTCPLSTVIVPTGP